MDRFIEQYFDLGLMWDSRGDILHGFFETLQLSIVAGVLALLWGLVLAILRQTPGKAGAIVRIPTIAYIDVFRGIPLLLVILIISGGLGALAAPEIGNPGSGGAIPRWIGIPEWFGKPDPFWYGVFALTITYGAYMAEVYRAGIEAVPEGQMEAARSLGMSHRQSMRHIIVPQAVSKVIPPLLNDFIALMKDTSLVGVIAFMEVVAVGNDIYSETYNSSALVLGALCFLVVTIPLARIVDWLIARQKRRVSRGGGVAADPLGPGGAPTGGIVG